MSFGAVAPNGVFGGSVSPNILPPMKEVGSSQR